MNKNSLTLSLTLILLMLYSSAKAQYSGNYTIGGTSPDFISIQSAADSLASQGVSGAVTLNIRDGVYNENVIQHIIAGVSSINTVTYQSESADSAAVKISVASGFNFYTDSVDYLRFQNLSFENTSSDTILYMHDVTNVEFSQNNFTGASAYGVYIESGDVDVESIVINNSSFSTAYGFNLSSVINVGSFALSGNKFNNSNNSVNIDCEGNLNSFASQNDSIISINGNGIYIDAKLNIRSSDIDDLYISTYDDAIWIDSEYDVLNTTLNNSTILSSNADGLHIRGYAGKIGNTLVENSTITTYDYAFYLTSNEAVDSVIVNNSRFESTNSGGSRIRGYYSGVTNVEVANSFCYGANAHGMYIESDLLVENVYFNNDSIITGSSNRGLYIDADQEIEHIIVDASYFESDTTSSGGYAFELYNSDYILNDISIKNSTFLGSGGIDIEGNTYSNNVLIDNCTVNATHSDALKTYFDDNEANTWTISNSTFRSEEGTGVRLYGSDAAFYNIHIDNCNIWGRYKGLYLDSDDDMHNCSVRNCTITAKEGYAVDVETYNGGLRNFVLDSTICTRILPGRVAEIESNYLVGDSIWITNSSFICDSIDPNSYGEALDLESDYGDWFNVWVQNNVFKGYDGLKIEADYGGTHNVWVEHNTIIAYNRGIYVDGIGTDCHIQYNTIDPDSDVLHRGIEIRGSEGISEGFYIENNTIGNIDEYGIYLYNGHNYYVRNNSLIASEATQNAELLKVYNVKKHMEISGNKLYAEHEMYGIYVSNSNFLDADALIANNFISGTDYSIFIQSSSKLNLIHNSTSSSSNVAALRLSSVNEIDAYNNIFSINNGGTGEVYDFWSASTINLDYNVFEFDTIGNNFSGSDYVTNGLSQWSMTTGYDVNSFYANPSYVNDTTDLHTDCSGSVLVAGTPIAYVMLDVDGNSRAAIPTIGADEILANGNVFEIDTAWVCDSPIELNAGASSGSVTYAWNTGESTQVIDVSNVGTYSVTVTDACGLYSDTMIVAYNPETIANATNTISFLTASFSKSSENAASYLWDFGDGTVSTVENPIHVYATTGIYTVSLIAYGNCNNDTLTFEVIPTVVSVEELIEESGRVSVYPNPTNGNFNIKLEGIIANSIQVSIIDITGQIVDVDILSEVSGNAIYSKDISMLSDGIYFVNLILNNNQSKVIRVVKN